MANRIYLDLEFKTGNLYQFSKDPKEGFEEHISKTNKISYRKYFKKGVYGIYRGTTVRDNNFGKQISIHLIDKDNNNVYINFPLFDAKKDIASYAESFIMVLPSMQMNYVYRVFPYAMDRETGEGKNYGVSVKHADMHDETIREDYPLKRLTSAYNRKDGTQEPGDVPAINWKQHFDGTKVKDRTERDAYLYKVLSDNSQEYTQGASNKVSGGEAPKPYNADQAGLNPSPSSEMEKEPQQDAPAPAPEPTPTPEPAPAPAPAQGATNQESKEGADKTSKLPF